MAYNRNTDLSVYLAKIEGTEGTDSVPVVGSDAIDLAEWFAPVDDDAFQPSTEVRLAGHLHPDIPMKMAGKNIKQSRKAHWRGSSVAITGADRAHKIELDPWFLASGHAATYAGGAGAEHVDYTLADTNLPTMSEYFFQDGLKYIYLGTRGNLTCTFQAGGPIDLTFAVEGRAGTVSNTAVPSPTFITTDWPLATDAPVFNFNGVSGVLQSWEHTTGNTLMLRKAVNALDGIQNWRISRRDPTFKMVVEEGLLSDQDWRNLRDNKTACAVNWTIGATLYQTMQFAAATVYVRKVTPGNDATLATVNIEGVIRGNTPYTWTMK